MQDTPDLSKIVNLIMQNPSLIEQISALANQDNEEKSETQPDDNSVQTNSTLEENANAQPFVRSSRSHRNELLSALKPYLSESRRTAVDSMMSIADILDMMRKK